jgi:CHAD domain-containing protein/uncharacterized protein Yka (UPF0111/DUF47 family)
MTTARPDKWVRGVCPDDRTSDVAVRTLRARLAAIQHYLPLAAEMAEEDVEHVHLLRVWARRAAAALKLYAGLLPRRRTVWMKKQLKRLRSAANDARDCDVLARRLTQDHTHAEAESWANKVRAQRAEAQKPIVEIFERLKRDECFDRRVTKLLRRVRPRSKHGHRPEDQLFGDWARASLRPLIEAFFAAVPVDGTDMAALHAFRIRGKELRYGMELLAGAFGPDLREKLYPLVETLQDRLGALNDLATAQTRLCKAIKEADGPAEAEHLQKLLAEEQARFEQVHREFLNWFTPPLRQQLRAGFDSLLAVSMRAEQVLKRAFCSSAFPDPPGEDEARPSRVSTGTEVRGGAGKTKMVGELGEEALLLPGLINEALAANDRAKYLMTLLQAARSHADQPESSPTDLKQERLACGIGDDSFDSVVERSHVKGHGVYLIPACAQIHTLLVENIRQMVAPLRVRDTIAPANGRPRKTGYEERLAELLSEVPPLEEDRLTGDYIDHITSGQRNGHDSLHLLVMDLHKELNQLQQQIASESIAGAGVYAVEETDRPLIGAFMAGVNQTKALKFDHPGLGTTATRSGGKLVIQNDIGTTDAHVLVVHVEPPKVTMTHTDVHLQRLLFFQGMFSRYAVEWEDTRSKRAAGLKDQLYHLCLGTYVARGERDLQEYLQFLGSRLVFLIDWNRARKRLRKLAPKRVCLQVLGWAAEQNCGHRGLLQLGGEMLILDALQVAGKVPLPLGGQLADVLGPERVSDFLKFALKTAAEGLLAGRSEFLIRDEISAELRHYLDTAHEGMLQLAAAHASLIVELAVAVRDSLLTANRAGNREYVERAAQRAKRWEHSADELVTKVRTTRERSDTAKAIPELLAIADDAADELEEALFLLTLLPSGDAAAPSFLPLHELASLLVQGAQEYLKAVENARQLQRGSARLQVQDFLAAVDRTITIEHHTDDAHRQAQASILTFAGDFKMLHLFTEIADDLEEAADTLMRSVLTLRDYVLSEVLTR